MVIPPLWEHLPWWTASYPPPCNLRILSLYQLKRNMLLGCFYIGTLGGNAIFLGGSILIFFVLLYTNAPNTSVLSYLSWIIHSAQNAHALGCSAVSDSLLPRDCSPPGSSVHGDSPGKTTGVDCHAIPQWIFPIQRSNLGLPHCRQTLYHLNHQGSPIFPSKSY